MEDITGHAQRQRRPGSRSGREFLLAPLLIQGFAEPDLFEDAHQELVDVVLDPARCFDELAIVPLGQLLAICTKSGGDGH